MDKTATLTINVKTAGAIAGILSLNKAMRAFAANARTFEDRVGNMQASVERLRTATAGIIGDIDLVTAKLKLQQSGLVLTERQMNAAAKAAIALGRATGEDFGSALQRVIDGVVGGRSRVFKELGSGFDLLGTAAEKTAQAMGFLERKFGDASIEAINTNERVAQLKNELQSTFGELGASVLKSKEFVGAMRWIRDTVKDLTWAVKGLTGQLELGSKSLARWLDFLGQAAKVIPGLPSSMRAKLSGSFESLQKVNAVVQTQKETAKGQAAATEDLIFGGWDRLAGVSTLSGRTAAAKKKKQTGIGDSGPSALPIGDMDANAALLGGALGGAGAGAALQGANDRISQEIEKNRELAEIKKQMYVDEYEQAERRERINARLERQDRIREKAENAHIKQTLQNIKLEEERNQGLKDLAMGGLQQFATGMLMSAAAALESGQSFGKAMLQMVKSTVLGIAQQAIVRALFETAAGYSSLATYQYWSASQHFLSAKIFGGVGIAAGAVGLGLSAASGASAGGGGGGHGLSTGEMRLHAGGNRTSFGTEREREKREFTVKIFLGDSRNRGARMLQQQLVKDQISAQLMAQS